MITHSNFGDAEQYRWSTESVEEENAEPVIRKARIASSVLKISTIKQESVSPSGEVFVREVVESMPSVDTRSMSVPDLTLSIKDLLNRYLAGEDVSSFFSGGPLVYDEDDSDSVSPANVLGKDLTAIDEARAATARAEEAYKKASAPKEAPTSEAPSTQES